MPTAEAKYTLTADDKTGRAFESVKAKFRTTARAATKTAAGIAAAGLAGFAAMARQAINSADEIGKLSREIGISTQNLSEMQGVLELTGGSFEGYTQSLRRMQRSVTDFADGSASMKEAFSSIGLTLEDLQGLSPEEQFDAITRGLAGVADESLRSARAQEIFGRNSRTVLRLVTTGADEIARLREEQRQMGNSLDSNTTAAAERFNDAIARMGQSLRGAVVTAVGENIDSMAQSMETIVSLIPPVIKAVAFVAQLVRGAGQLLGGGAATLGALASGNFAQAGNIIRDVGSDVFGVDIGALVGKQDETNTLLRQINTNVGVARAG